MLKCILVAAAWMAFVDYGGPANNRNANAATRGTAAPMADALLDLEKHATEAFFKGDGRFFERVLSDKLVMTEGGHRISKTSFIKRVTGSKCKVQEGWSLTDPQIEKIDDDTYVLSYKATVDCVCTYSGRTEKQASPVRAATVWVRNDEKWQAAFHGENPIVEPKALSAAGKTDESKQRNPKIGAPAASGSAKPNADPGTDALMAAEKSVWEAWKTKDAKKLESLTAQDITFVNIFGTYFANKADAVKDWTGATCDAKSFSLTDGAATFISPTVGILTVTASVDGTCGGQKPPPVYGTSVYVRDGGAWKWAFGFNSPH